MGEINEKDIIKYIVKMSKTQLGVDVKYHLILEKTQKKKSQKLHARGFFRFEQIKLLLVCNVFY